MLLRGVVASRAIADDADLKVTVTNGSDTKGEAHVDVRPAGQHGGNVIASGRSGDDIKVPPGTYDVEVSFNDGAANKIVWFDGLAISGHVEKSLDIGMPVATLHVLVANGGTDVVGNGGFEVRPAGNHGGDVIASGRSGDTARLAAGTYDLDVRFNDGAVNKMIWLDGVALSGPVDKVMTTMPTGSRTAGWSCGAPTAADRCNARDGRWRTAPRTPYAVDAASLARPAFADRNWIIASAAALMAAVTTR